MDSKPTKEDYKIALQNYKGITPQRTELGGDYYYKCGWLSCNSDINQYMNYCPVCGTRIIW